MAIKELSTRFQADCRTISEWESQNPIAKKGEPMIVEITPEETSNLNNKSNYLIKIGDGVSTFSELNYISGLSADVYPWALEPNKPSYTADEISGLSTLLEDKVDKVQDSSNVGKVLGISENGEISPIDNDNFLKLKNLPWTLLDLSNNDKDMDSLAPGQYVVINGGQLFNKLDLTTNKESVNLSVGDFIFKNQTNGTQILSGQSGYYITDYDKPFLDNYYFTRAEHDGDMSEKLAQKQDSLFFTDNVKLTGRKNNIVSADCNKTYVFDTYENLSSWLDGDYTREDGKEVSDLNEGDTLCISENDTPDYWWDGTQIQPYEIGKYKILNTIYNDWKLISDDTLTEPVTYILKNQDADGSSLNLKHAIIYIYTPKTTTTDGLVMKCSNVIAGTDQVSGGCGYLSAVISSSSDKYTIIEMECSNFFIYTRISTGTTFNTISSSHSRNINTSFSSLNNILIRLNNMENTFPTGTRIQIWGY